MPDRNIIKGSRLEAFHVAGWRGRVEHRWRHIADGDPLEWLTQQSPQTVRQRPSAISYRVATDAGAVYVKHMTALKDREAEAADWPSRLRWRLQPSLTLRILRVHRQLARCGLLVAPVLLAARRCSGWRCEELLVTGEVPGSDLFRALVDGPDDAARSDLIRMTGRRVAELHRLRFSHGDLLPGNLVVTPDRTNVVWLDNDRSRRWFPLVPVSVRRRNLAQIAFRLVYWFRYRWMRQFLDSYYQGCRLGTATRRRESAQLLRRARARTWRARMGPGRQLPRLG
ncbi:MAG: lipopolysaccharide kinase InaA family protein [Planctomycetota bacterium]|jgi:hypothetical protein